ncbi:23S rRNA (pseudouridine(1915)-N(3))-methyltransferase RlmH [candidate division WOR-3 bacterium]|nr:23S rRNA (pseudouridine(1915)-N(3))-methyltransferase RlmH [candidate division WOR-3 bacterium]
MLREIKIIQVGRDKFKYVDLIKSDYLGRLGHYFTVNEVIIRESRSGDKITKLREEAKEIKKHFKRNSALIILSPEGIEMDSVKFSKFIYKFPSITFVIGGSDGLCEEIKILGDYIISFSKMTFPHHLAKILLLEQLYRAASIKHNRKYHK